MLGTLGEIPRILPLYKTLNPNTCTLYINSAINPCIISEDLINNPLAEEINQMKEYKLLI